MKRFIYILIFAALIGGCSDTDPEITETSISDSAPVIGQRILLQVDCLGDNYPFQFHWTVTDGELEDDNDEEEYYWTYWIAPATEGVYTVSCTVTDDEDHSTTTTFEISVGDRGDDGVAIEKFDNALCMAKYRLAKLGGIRIALLDDNIQYLSADSSSEIEWGDEYEFDAMAIQGSTSSILQTIWGAVYDGVDSCSLYYYSGETGSIELVDENNNDTPYNTGTVNDMEFDDNGILWIGADNGLYKYNTTSGSTTCTPVALSGKWVNDIYIGDLTLAATSSGIYEYDNGTWSAMGAPYDATTYAVTEGTSGVIWSIVDEGDGKKVVKGGDTILGSQPDSVADSIDIDLLNRIWCGKYYWTGTEWLNPTGIEDPVIITESLVSPEGLLYLISESDELYSW